jgi:hypothetical protein
MIRIAAAWMGKSYQKLMFKASPRKDVLLDAADKAKSSETLPEKLSNKCRSFGWYAKEVNRDLPLF